MHEDEAYRLVRVLNLIVKKEAGIKNKTVLVICSVPTTFDVNLINKRGHKPDHDGLSVERKIIMLPMTTETFPSTVKVSQPFGRDAHEAWSTH